MHKIVFGSGFMQILLYSNYCSIIKDIFLQGNEKLILYKKRSLPHILRNKYVYFAKITIFLLMHYIYNKFINKREGEENDNRKKNQNVFVDRTFE